MSTRSETLTVTTTPIVLTASVYTVSGKVANFSLFTCRSGQVSFCFDTTTDLSTGGHLLSAGDTIRLESSEFITSLRLRSVAGSSVVYLTYELPVSPMVTVS